METEPIPLTSPISQPSCSMEPDLGIGKALPIPKSGSMEHEGWEMGEVRGIGSVSI